MKKTLLSTALFLLMGMPNVTADDLGQSATLDIEDVTITLSAAFPSQGYARAGFTAFDFALTSDWLTREGSLGDVVALSEMGVSFANTWYTQSTSKPIGIAIFSKQGDSSWSFVGKSEWLTTITISNEAPKENLTSFAFDDLQLVASRTYTAVFYGIKDAFDALNSASVLTSLSGLQTPNASTPIAVAGLNYNGSTSQNLLYKDAAATLSAGTPMVTFTGKNVPEPATAALSLLALAGLAARRRRK